MTTFCFDSRVWSFLFPESGIIKHMILFVSVVSFGQTANVFLGIAKEICFWYKARMRCFLIDFDDRNLSRRNSLNNRISCNDNIHFRVSFRTVFLRSFDLPFKNVAGFQVSLEKCDSERYIRYRIMPKYHASEGHTAFMRWFSRVPQDGSISVQ
jgi:hypothetical protein